MRPLPHPPSGLPGATFGIETLGGRATAAVAVLGKAGLVGNDPAASSWGRQNCRSSPAATTAFEERAIPLELAHRRFDGRSHDGSRPPPPFLPLAPRDLLLAMILPIMWCVPDAHFATRRKGQSGFCAISAPCWSGHAAAFTVAGRRAHAIIRSRIYAHCPASAPVRQN